jgi:hypothetical protein
MTEFWKSKSLDELTTDEWESLCDRCGRCCLIKLEDIETGKIYFTNIVCRHLEQSHCQCRHYQSRTELVADCLKLTPDSLPSLLDHLPPSCAYRRLAQGLSLPEWHPLISGDPDSVARAGISVCGKVISEEYIHPEQYEEHIIYWFELEEDETADNIIANP